MDKRQYIILGLVAASALAVTLYVVYGNRGGENSGASRSMPFQQEEGNDASASAGQAAAGQAEVIKTSGTNDYLKEARKLKDMGDLKRACDHIRQNTVAKAKSPDAWLWQGYCSLEFGNPESASSELLTARNRGSAQNEILAIGLAEGFRRQGKIKVALKYYELYLKEFPEGSDASIAGKYKDKLSKFLESADPQKPCEKGLCEPENLSFFH